MVPKLKFLFLLIYVFATFSFTARANVVQQIKTTIASADSLQNSCDYVGAINLFKRAETVCKANNLFYSKDMQYILGSLATCAQQIEDYDLFLSSLSKLDQIGSKIGYDNEIPESLICSEVAKGLLWREASDEDLEKAKNYISRGSQKDIDPDNIPYWDCLTHKLNYLLASRISNLEEAAPVLEQEYYYFTNICKLPREEVYYELFESGILWSKNLMDRTHNKECYDLLLSMNSLLLQIIPDFYSLELEVAKMYALANLSENEKCIDLGNRTLAITQEDESSFNLLSAIKYNIGRCYNGIEKYQDALNTLQSIYTSPYACQLENIDTGFVKLEIAIAFFGLGNLKESQDVCREILKGKPTGSTLAGVNLILGAIASNDNNKLELGFIDDCVDALNMMEYEDLSYAETLAVFAKRYASYYQYESALSLINKSIDMFERRGATNIMDYYSALCLQGTLCARFVDMDGFSESAQKLTNNIDNIKQILSKEQDYELITDFLETILSSYYFVFSVAYYHFQKAIADGEVTEAQMDEALTAIESYKSQIIQLSNIIIEDNDYITWLIENNPDRLGALYHNIALMYRDLKQYDDGIEYVDNVLPNLPKTCDMYSVISELRDYMYLYKDGPERHVSFIQNKFESDKICLKELLSSLSSNRRSEMWRQFYGRINNYVEYAHTANNNPQINKIAFNAILLSKGLLLQSETDFVNRILRTDDEKIIGQYKKWLELTGDNSDEASIVEREIIRSLNSDFESELFNLTWEDVQSYLMRNEYAVEFRAYDNYGKKQYLAFIVGKSYSAPKMVEICNSDDLHHIGENDDFDYSKLSKIVWSKLNNIIPASSTVYFSPDMQLHSFPLENLPDFENSNEFIANRWKLYRVSSTRQLTQNHQQIQERNIDLFGGFDYNIDAVNLISDYNENVTNYRSINIDCSEMRGALSTVRDLPGSRREVSQIKELFASHDMKYTEYTDRKGTESCFKAYAGKKGNILHISTHGFYIAPSSNYGQLSRILGLTSDYDSNENALLRSGLMMAGVNETILGKLNNLECEDGILTAKEISELNLDKTDIAVLSACETGVGAISGDGVFGLQRGFKLAGVKSIMMSLWKVEDNATERLMIEFYRNWIETNDVQKALLTAQSVIRNTPGWEDPKYWASFILLDALN